MLVLAMTCKDNSFSLVFFIIPLRFCILYGSKINAFVKHAVLWIVACSAGIQTALYLDVDCSQIMIACFRFIRRLFVVRYYLLCVPYLRYSRILHRIGGVLLIDFLIHRRAVVIEPVSMHFATICAFSETVNVILGIFFKLGILIGRFLEPKKFDADD